MAVDLHTGDISLPYQFLLDSEAELIPPRSHDHNHFNNNINGSSALKPQLPIPHEFAHSTQAQGKHKVDDDDDDDDDEYFIAQLTHHMPHFMLQDDDEFDFSSIASDNLESSWDSTGSPQSALWSPLASSQGSTEGSSAAPGSSHDSCWENTYDVVGMLEEMKLEERGNSKYHPSYGTQSLKKSNDGLCSYQSLIQEQIRAIQLSRLKQEQILSLKQKLAAYRESHGQVPHQYEPNEQILQFQKKGRGVGVGSGNGGRTRPTLPGPLYQLQSQQQAGSEMWALFLGGSGSTGASCGTGVFLPRGGSRSRTSAPSESRKRPGKGCSTVLIPARVVQALQLHFDQMAATSGPKAAGFPPLHDVLVSNRDGMYSLQKRQSRKARANIQNEMILPQEWTY